MTRFYATLSMKLIHIDNQIIVKKNFQLVPFGELKYLVDKKKNLKYI